VVVFGVRGSRPSGTPGSGALPRGQLQESAHLLTAKLTDPARLEAAQLDRADPDTLEATDWMAQPGKHSANLPVAPFPKCDFQ
jgi:hypothetical protein